MDARGEPVEELVALVDADGGVVGSVSRSRMRRENLPHAATAVLVRNGRGDIYVHQRSPDKDWRPSAYDAAAGGVLQYGEQPLVAARRELREELGVVGVELRPLGTSRYEDDTVRCVTHAFEATYDGPVTHEDGEVVAGEWLPLAVLGARLRDPGWSFVPDTRALLARLSDRHVADYRRLGAVAAGPEPP